MTKPIDDLLIKEIFEYDGKGLVWRVNKGRAVIGQRAYLLNTGYKTLRVNGVSYLEHRLVWAWHYGLVPDVIDHINGNTADNRIENLRAASSSDNMRNSKISSSNKSGVKGVSWSAHRNKWVAQLRFNNKQHNLGGFDTLEEAAEAVNTARLKHHGNFANNGVNND